MILDKFHSRSSKKQQQQQEQHSLEQDSSMNSNLADVSMSSNSSPHSRDEMVTKNKFFSVSPQKKHNKMVQLASLTTSFQASGNNEQKINCSTPNTVRYNSPSTAGALHNSYKKNDVLQNNAHIQSLAAPTPIHDSFIGEQTAVYSQTPSTLLGKDFPSTPVFYKHQYQNSVSSFASSIDDNTPTGHYPPLAFNPSFIQVLLETYQEYCSEPTVTPFDDANPPYGVTNIVAKIALKKSIEKNVSVTVSSNPFETNNSANVLSAIRKQLIKEVKRDMQVYQSKNNSVISLGNIPMGLGSSMNESWSISPQIPPQMPMYNSELFQEQSVSSTPFLNQPTLNSSSEIQNYNMNNFQYPQTQNSFYLNQSVGTNNGLNSPCEIYPNSNNVLSPLEKYSSQQQQQQQQQPLPNTNFTRPSFRSRKNSLLSDLTKTRSNSNTFMYSNSNTSTPTGSGALAHGGHTHVSHSTFQNPLLQPASHKTPEMNRTSSGSGTLGKRHKGSSKSNEFFQ